MASIRARLERVKHDPMVLIDPGCVAAACRGAGHHWRERTLGPVETLEAFAVQMAHGNTPIAHVVRLMGNRFSESAYCQARARLPVAVVRTTLSRFTALAGDEGGLWRGHRVVLIDGTGVSTPDTPTRCASAMALLVLTDPPGRTSVITTRGWGIKKPG